MFVEFNVENFRSIKDRVTLSLVAANLRSRNPKLDKDTTIEVNSKLTLLRSALIYGANASGKSNVFNAFRFMQSMVIDSARESQAEDLIHVEPFRLNIDSAAKPSTFEVIFLLNGIQYRYGFSANTKHIVAEWLYYVPTIREVELFTRDEEGLHIGTKFSEGRGLEKRTRKNALFLSVVAQFDGSIATKILSWFSNTCCTLNSLKDYIKPNTIEYFETGKYREQIESLVCQLDLDITKLSIMNMQEPSVMDMAALNGKELLTRHPIRDNNGKIVDETDFPIDKMESEGTKKLIDLAGIIVETLVNGNVLYVDEIDARLHPIITAAFLRLFNSTETNPNNAQLICVTHDTNLLDRRYYRRDQVYFTEKDRNASTKLFSLADFKLDDKGVARTVRNDASYENDYINGRYGAIPYVGDLARLFIEEHPDVHSR